MSRFIVKNKGKAIWSPAFRPVDISQGGVCIPSLTGNKGVRPVKILMLLRDMGIRNAKLDTVAWQPEQADILRKPRPAAAAQMKAAHEAVAHDKWFRQQVEIGLTDMKAGNVRPFSEFRLEFEAEESAS